TPPDTATLRRQAEFPALVGKDTVRPLDSYLSKSTIIKKGDFYPRTVEMNSVGGKLYGLPSTVNLYLLYYNKNLFQQQGLKLPDLTWDYNDFDEAAQKLTKRTPEQFQQAGVDMPTWWVVHYLGNHGVGIWQGGLLDKGTCSRVNYDKTEVIAGYEWWQKHYCKLRTTEGANKDKVTAFERGNAAMLLSWPRMGEFKDKIGDQFDWGMTLAPLGDKKKPRTQTIIGAGAAIFKESPSPDLAWAFIEFFNDPQFMLEQVRSEGALSIYANRRIMESKEYKSSTVPPADKSLFTTGLEAGKFFPEASWEMRAMGVESPKTDIGKAMDCSAAPREVLPPGAEAINGTLKQAGVGC
ncbi:MAG TPA: extracellular solute-binding protein, partial [Chloroflexota bacterium]|nr:extracellular solute-binding protein [Chloroflexota bacterium]